MKRKAGLLIFLSLVSAVICMICLKQDYVIVVEGVVLEDGMLETVITEVSESGAARTIYKNTGISMAYSYV